MESLDLETGYKGVMAKREERLAALAHKYSSEINDFEEEEKRVKQEVSEAATQGTDWLKNSIR